MKKFAVVLSWLCGSWCSLPAQALEALPPAAMDGPRTYRVEVLQVTDIQPYQQALDGFVAALQEAGFRPGENLEIQRTKVDFDVERGGFWDKLGVILRLRDEARRIAQAKPDLVLTIGTPATRYARAILDEARVPLVFTAVANPLDAGCPSLTDAGPGATGATLYTDMAQSLQVVKQVFPGVQQIGMVHTDDENGIAHVEAAKASARELGLHVASRQVGKSDSIVPSLKQLHAGGDGGAGAQMFAVPLDTYYGLRNFEPAKDLGDFGGEYRLPVVSFALVRVPGAMLYVGADFRAVGALSGVQAAKILKRQIKPEILPILRQDRPTVLVDPQRLAELKLALPAALMERKTEVPGGFWQLKTPDTWPSHPPPERKE
ncbi:MAG: ABC transporter substrate binding protein [Pseudomonadota bacterium]